GHLEQTFVRSVRHGRAHLVRVLATDLVEAQDLLKLVHEGVADQLVIDRDGTLVVIDIRASEGRTRSVIARAMLADGRELEGSTARDILETVAVHELGLAGERAKDFLTEQGQHQGAFIATIVNLTGTGEGEIG